MTTSIPTSGRRRSPQRHRSLSVLATRRHRRRSRPASTPVPCGHRELAHDLEHRHRRAHRQRRLANEVHIVGKKRWRTVDGARSPTATNMFGITPRRADLAAWAAEHGLAAHRDRRLAGLDPARGRHAPGGLRLVFGQEGPGLSDAIRPFLDQTRSIAQFDRRGPINAGVASGIAMHAWISNTPRSRRTVDPSTAPDPAALNPRGVPAASCRES
ncbi:MAG: hypothetical protein R2710_15345 [Acidimicrobiales bacterium]